MSDTGNDARGPTPDEARDDQRAPASHETTSAAAARQPHPEDPAEGGPRSDTGAAHGSADGLTGEQDAKPGGEPSGKQDAKPGDEQDGGRADGPSGGPGEEPAGGAPEAGEEPDPWRGLARSSEGRILTGVCAGLGRHTGMDPVLFRVGFSVLLLGSGIGGILYIAAFLLMRETDGGPGYLEQWTRRSFDSETVMALLTGVFAAGLIMNVASGGIGPGTLVVGTMLAVALLAAHAGGVDVLAVIRSLPERVTGKRGVRRAPAFDPMHLHSRSNVSTNPSPQRGFTPAAAQASAPPPHPAPPYSPPAEGPGHGAPRPDASGYGEPRPAAPTYAYPAASSASSGGVTESRARSEAPPTETRSWESSQDTAGHTRTYPGDNVTGDRDQPYRWSRDQGLDDHPSYAGAGRVQPGQRYEDRFYDQPYGEPLHADGLYGERRPYAAGMPSYDSSGAPFAPHGPFRPLDPRLRYGAGTIPVPVRQRRPRTFLGTITVFLAFIVGGIVVAIQGTSGATISMPVVGGAMLLTVGAGLLVATWFGRGAALVAAGTVLALVVALASSTMMEAPRSVGSFTWQPTNLATASRSYDVGVGDGTLDLTRLKLPAGSRTEFDASVSLGELVVILPPDVRVEVTGMARLGDIQIDHSVKGGSNVRHERKLEPEAPPKGRVATVVLTLKVGVGDVEVRRAA
ncbi:PspC domain-containing protein [Streptosporangium soli]|nr:PspC domain-containing protein [Streptosporangium sp. KLBMP 9127]